MIWPRKHFGPLPPSELTPPKPAGNYRNWASAGSWVKPRRKYPRPVWLQGTDPETATEAWEPYALDVLEGILDGGNSSRISLIWCVVFPDRRRRRCRLSNLTRGCRTVSTGRVTHAGSHQRRTGIGPASRSRQTGARSRSAPRNWQSRPSGCLMFISRTLSPGWLGMPETVGLGWNWTGRPR